MGNCRRCWTQQEKRDNQRLIPTGNPRFTIFGLSQQEKFKVSWIQQEKKDNQDSFWWKISAEILFHISMGNCRRSWIQWERRENQRLISTGNYKFSKVKLEVVIYRTIFLNPLSPLWTSKISTKPQYCGYVFRQHMWSNCCLSMTMAWVYVLVTSGDPSFSSYVWSCGGPWDLVFNT